MENRQWYNNLNKSMFTPPNYIFSIVWPILYILIFYSFYNIILKCHSNNSYYCKLAIFLFLVHLIFNLIWTKLFFREKNIKMALFDLILVIFSCIIIIYLFYKINKISSYILIPYILWLIFAFYLNMLIYINNNQE